MANQRCITVEPPPEKSLTDKKEYRVIRLENGLTALLVSDLASFKEGEERKSQIDWAHDSDYEDPEDESYHTDDDPESDSSSGSDSDAFSSDEREHIEQEEYLPAAAMSVRAGSLEDPADIGGLMHFLEHMVFMGSEKYPNESFFDAFIQKHGGYNNAQTDLEHTTYYFEIQEEYFKKCLDIFAQFFINPLIKTDAIDREKKSVNSEFQLALPSDYNRIERFVGSLANEGHPLSNFLYGNEKTLDLNISGDQLRLLLLETREKYYSAQNMSLVVQAREDLDTLESWVTEIFSLVPNSKLPRPTYDHLGFPYNMNRWNKLYGIIPVKDITVVELRWVFPSQLHNYKEKPFDYISHLVGDEGEGSILSLLKKKLYAVSLAAGTDEYDDNTCCSFFSIRINLTEDGLTNVKEVVAVVFQYLNLMRNQKPVDWIYDEIKSVERIGFDFETEDSPMENVEQFSINMNNYPSQHYLTGDSQMYKYDPKLIEELLSEMTINKCNITIQSKNYNKKGLCDMTEKWFEIKHFCKDIPSDWIDYWNENKTNSDLSFPVANQYVPTDFTMLPKNPDCGQYPLRIHNTLRGELFYKQDQKFGLPKGHCYALLCNKDWNSSPKMSAMTNMFVRIFHHVSAEKLYPISMALYDYKLSSDDKGLIVKIDGFNQNLSKCLQVFKDCYNSIMSNITEELFEHLKKEQLKSYHNFLISPEKMKMEVRLNILADHHWDSGSKLIALKDLTIEQFRKECQFDCYYTKMLVQGNVTSDEAIEMFDIIKSKDESAKSKLFEPCSRKLLDGNWITRLPSLDQSSTNSVVVNYYQDGPGTVWKEVLNGFLLYLMSEPSFDYLRTKETLGYSVSSSSRVTNGILGFTLTVHYHADKHNADLVDRKIEEFLKSFRGYIRKMPASEFLEFKDSYRKDKNLVDLSLEDEISRNWLEIIDGSYVFDRLMRHYDLIPKINREAVISRLNKMIGAKGDPHKKLSVQIEGSEVPEWSSCPEFKDTIKCPYEELVRCIQPDQKKDYKFITNIDNYKKGLTFYPVTKIK